MSLTTVRSPNSAGTSPTALSGSPRQQATPANGLATPASADATQDTPSFLLTFRDRATISQKHQNACASHDTNTFMRKRGRSVRPKELTPAQVREARQWFDLLDSDGNGDLDVDEITYALRAIQLDVSRHDVVAMLEQVELNETQSLAFADFLVMISAALNNDGDESNISSALGAQGKTFAEAAQAAQRKQFLEHIMKGGMTRKRAIRERLIMLKDTPALAQEASDTFDLAKRNALAMLHKYANKNDPNAHADEDVNALDMNGIDVPPAVILMELVEIWKVRRKEAEKALDAVNDESSDDDVPTISRSVTRAPSFMQSLHYDPNEIPKASIMPHVGRRSVFMKRRDLSHFAASPRFDSDEIDRALRRKLPSLGAYRAKSEGALSDGHTMVEWSEAAMKERELQAKRRMETLLASANRGKKSSRTMSTTPAYTATPRDHVSFARREHDSSSTRHVGMSNALMSPRMPLSSRRSPPVPLLKLPSHAADKLTPRPPHAVPHPSPRHIMQHRGQARHLHDSLTGASSVLTGPLGVV